MLTSNPLVCRNAGVAVTDFRSLVKIRVSDRVKSRLLPLHAKNNAPRICSLFVMTAADLTLDGRV